MAKTDEKVCRHCGKVLNIKKEDFVLSGTRYAHVECDESFMEKMKKAAEGVGKETPQKDLRICLYCGEKINIKKEDWKMARANRYAHLSCYIQYHTEDDEYIDIIYEFLAKDLKVAYDYHMIEAQRKKFLRDGYTNKGIFLSLKYFYKYKKGNWAKSNGGIGIVPYIYKDAEQFWIKRVQKQQQIVKTLKQQAETSKPIVIKTSRIGTNTKENKKIIDIGELLDETDTE